MNFLMENHHDALDSQGAVFCRDQSRPKAGVRGLREAALLPGETPAFESLYTAPLLPAPVARFGEGRG